MTVRDGQEDLVLWIVVIMNVNKNKTEKSIYAIRSNWFAITFVSKLSRKIIIRKLIAILHDEVMFHVRSCDKSCNVVTVS